MRISLKPRKVKTMSLLHELEYHDWYYMMSDDPNVWGKGVEAEEHLRSKIRSLGCPHTMAELRMAVQGMILEDFHEYEEGKYWKVPKQKVRQATQLPVHAYIATSEWPEFIISRLPTASTSALVGVHAGLMFG